MRQFIAVIAEPRPAFFDDVVLDAEVQNFAGTRNTFAKHNIEFGTTERRRNLVLNHLNDGAFAQIVIAIFDGAAGTDIQTYGSIEFERIAAGGGFAGAEHLAYFLTQLVDEYTCGLGARDGGSELTHGLRHQSCLQSHIAITHFALYFAFGRKGCHRIDHHDVHSSATYQLLGYLEGLFAVVRLRNQQFIGIYTQRLGIEAVKGMFGIYKRCNTAGFLGLGYGMERQGCLTGRLGTIYLDDTSLGIAADTQSMIQRNRPGGYHFDILYGFVS